MSTVGRNGVENEDARPEIKQKGDYKAPGLQIHHPSSKLAFLNNYLQVRRNWFAYDVVL